MERNILVDKLKGYTCFLVLFGHVIMGIRLAGVYMPSFFEGLEKFIWSFHVALFLFLSGVVYKETGEWKTKKTKLKFILYKLLSLGVPYITFSVIYIAINSFVGGANNQSSYKDILSILWAPVAQYWYLYALFFLFVIWALLGGILKNWLIYTIVLLIAYGFPIIGISLGCFEVVFYSAFTFGLGTFLNFSKLPKVPNLLKYLTILLHIATGIVFIYLNKIESIVFKEIMNLLGIYASILLISLLQDLKIVSRFLLYINKYSFQIYLLHTIFTAGIRMVMIKLSINSWVIHIIVGTACGLVFSVLAAEIAKKIKPLNFFFFPTKTKFVKTLFSNKT